MRDAHEGGMRRRYACKAREEDANVIPIGHPGSWERDTVELLLVLRRRL